jgi:hypothetical protein
MIKGNRIGAVIVVLSCALVAPATMAAPIAPGNGQQTVDIAGTRMTVFTYRSPNCSDPSLLLVFHGVARNARAYRDYARPLADRNCLLLAAPLFDQRDFPGWRYQRGGIVKGGAVQQEGRPLAYSLLGHSAGGQFLERLAAFVPTQARRIVVANPGSYVLPSVDVAAPYGLGKVYAGAAGEAQLRRYLELPLTIYLGEDDTRDDRDDSSEARAQGASRHQRGVNVAQARGWAFNWRLVELPGVGHSASKMFAAPQASDALAP